MAPLRVIFLMMIIVTVVSVTGVSSTKASSKVESAKKQIKEKSLKLEEQLKLSANSVAEKARETGGKVKSKFSALESSAKKSNTGSKARGLGTSARTKTKEVISMIKKQLHTVKNMIRSAQAAVAVQSKLSGLRKPVKNALRSGYFKGLSIKESMKDSDALKNIESKLSPKSVEQLKTLPGADTLRDLASSSTANTLKDKLSSATGTAVKLFS